MSSNKIAQNILGWGGLLLAIAGVAIGWSTRKATLSGGTLQCGSPWSPVDNDGIAIIYPAVAKACDKALGSWGTVAAGMLVVGIVMMIAVLAVSAMSLPAGAPGTTDHP